MSPWVWLGVGAVVVGGLVMATRSGAAPARGGGAAFALRVIVSFPDTILDFDSIFRRAVASFEQSAGLTGGNIVVQQVPSGTRWVGRGRVGAMVTWLMPERPSAVLTSSAQQHFSAITRGGEVSIEAGPGPASTLPQPAWAA